MKTKWGADRLIHVAELVWIGAWVALAILLLIGLNAGFETRHGEQNLWQVLFGFFF